VPRLRGMEFIMSKNQKRRKVVIIAGVVLLVLSVFISGFFINDNVLAITENNNTLIIFLLICVPLAIFHDFRKPTESQFTPSGVYTKLTILGVIYAFMPIFQLAQAFYYKEFYFFVQFVTFFILIAGLCVLNGYFDQIKLIKNDPNALTVIRNNRFISYELQKGTAWNDIPEEWFTLPKSVDTRDAYYLAYNTRNFYYGKKDYKTALAIALDLLRNAPISIPKKSTNMLKCDTLTIMIMNGEPPERIRACYENIRDFLYSTSGDDSTRAVKMTALFAYHSLIEKDEVRAEFAKEEFIKSIEKSPRKNQLTVENELIPEIEARAGNEDTDLQRCRGFSF
jgi:hypothetical protein